MIITINFYSHAFYAFYFLMFIEYMNVKDLKLYVYNLLV